MAPTLSWERWSLAVCLGDKTVFPAALLCRVGPGAGTGSRGGGQQQIPEQSPHTETTHTPTHDTLSTVTQADQLTPHTPDHGGIGAVARDRRVAERERQRARGAGASQRPAAETLPWFQHTIRGKYLLTYLLTQSPASVRVCLRAATRPGASAARARGTVKTSWATRRVKHAHHKTSRRRRRSGEDLGHPADERCGGLA